MSEDENEDKMRTNLWLTRAELERIDKLAGQKGTSRQDVIRQFVRLGFFILDANGVYVQTSDSPNVTQKVVLI